MAQEQEDLPLLLFAVRDTGIGIPESKLAAIFDTYVQAEGGERFGGSGLGLAIAKELVEMMGGNIWVRSREGQGSTFYFTVRFRVQAAPEAEAALETPAEPRPALVAPTRQLRVLVADDNAISRSLAQRLLARAGHAAVLAEDGDLALEILAGGGFDAAILDVRMPRVNGLEVTRRIRSGEAQGVDPGLPIVAMTAYALAGDRERCLAAGMDAYAPKPVSAASFHAALAEALHVRKA
jgi:CheY-like chemotaxis protein